jgi:hypothetical protein
MISERLVTSPEKRTTAARPDTELSRMADGASTPLIEGSGERRRSVGRSSPLTLYL